MRKNYSSQSLEETAAIAAEIAPSLKPGSVLALHGDLGAGKTSFTKALGKALGINSRISSPTFVVMREYESNTSNLRLYHLDMYRMEREEDVRSLDIQELFEDEHGVVVIEWAEKVAKLLPHDTIHIHFGVVGENTREIQLEQHT